MSGAEFVELGLPFFQGEGCVMETLTLTIKPKAINLKLVTKKATLKLNIKKAVLITLKKNVDIELDEIECLKE